MVATELKRTSEPHMAYCFGECDLCGEKYKGDDRVQELVVTVKERLAGGMYWFGIVHALCWVKQNRGEL